MSDTEFPPGLLELQRRWSAAEAAWASAPTDLTQAAFIAVGTELGAHPYWVGAENRHKAAIELKRTVLADAV
ncbi:hypothetical protein PUR61_24970 [Streptomyces sp. BE20]|uniref:hypothetical protein n=1 Tax=Streptomyces sp. BE20 TaxID=3002525 RepID=UPI002E7767E1|nr:hypothetical protein [Streptomyces sp. BE20]MEE1825408.1 hypothetical protein [Streptomyces sp. BE20]